MPEAKINVADQFEIGEEEMTVFLLNQAFGEGMLDKEDILISLHAEYGNKQSNIPHWKHAKFGLELLDVEKYMSDFRFTKQSIVSLCHVYGIHDTIKRINRNLTSSVEALSITLRQLGCPWRSCDMSHSFGYAFPSVDQVWLFSENFVNFSTAFHNKGRALDNC